MAGSKLTEPEAKSADEEPFAPTSGAAGQPKLFVLEPGKKAAVVTEPVSKVPSDEHYDDANQIDQTKPHTHADNNQIKDEIKRKPTDKSKPDQLHLNGDEAKTPGVTKSLPEVPKIIEEPVDTSDDRQTEAIDDHDSDTESLHSVQSVQSVQSVNELTRPRIQDRKGSIQELIPDKRHGFKLNLKVVAAQYCPLSSLLFQHFYYYLHFFKVLIFYRATSTFDQGIYYTHKPTDSRSKIILTFANYNYAEIRMLIYSVFKCHKQQVYTFIEPHLLRLFDENRK